MTFAKKLSELRKKSGLSQEQLAELLNVSRQSVSKWEGQQTLPETEKLIAMSNLFHISLDVLLKDEYELDDMPPYSPARREGTPEPDNRDEAAGPIRSTRPRRYRAAALGTAALLLAAVLIFGALAVRSDDPSTPAASVSGSTQTDIGITRKPSGSSDRQAQMKFKQYIRGIMKYITAQNEKSKGDSRYDQTP